MTAAAKQITVTPRVRGAVPMRDLRPRRPIARGETEAAGFKPPLPIKLSPELIAFHRQRAHRWRARAMRQAMRGAWQWIAGLWRHA